MGDPGPLAKRFMPPSKRGGAGVQIKAGLGDDQGDSVAGEITAVYGFDFNNSYIGQAGGGSSCAGGVVEVTIDQSEPGVHAE